MKEREGKVKETNHTNELEERLIGKGAKIMAENGNKQGQAGHGGDRVSWPRRVPMA